MWRPACVSERGSSRVVVSVCALVVMAIREILVSGSPRLFPLLRGESSAMTLSLPRHLANAETIDGRQLFTS